VNIDRDKTVNPLEHVVTLLERPARNRTRAHRDHIFRLGHLVVEPHHLRRHFLGHRSGDNHQVRLARRGPKHFRAKTRQVVARHRGGDHFNRATRQTKLQWPDRVLAPPVVNGFERGGENTAFAQFTS
jgi:hypothetical protein